MSVNAYVISVHRVSTAAYEMVQPAPVVFKADVWTRLVLVCTICNQGVKYYSDDAMLNEWIPLNGLLTKLAFKKKTHNLNLCNQNCHPRATELFVNLSAHPITDQWNLKSRAMPDRHRGNHGGVTGLMNEWMDVTEWGIACKWSQTCRRDARTVFAHSLTLASQEALKLATVVQLLGRITRVTASFRRSKHSQPAAKGILVLRALLFQWVNDSFASRR